MSIPRSQTVWTACSHCGKPVLHERQAEAIGQNEAVFCCNGCRFVFETIHRVGLSQFYSYRAREFTPGEDVEFQVETPSKDTYHEFDESSFWEEHVTSTSSGLARTTLYLHGIHCAACIWLTEKLPALMPGVYSSRLSFQTSCLEVTFSASEVKLSEIGRMLSSLGYPPSPLKDEKITADEKSEYRTLLLRLGIAAFASANTMMLAVSLFQGFFTGIEQDYADYFRWASMLLATPAVSYSAIPFYRSGFGALRSGGFHIDLPISVAILASYILSVYNTVTHNPYVYFDSVAALIFLLLGARLILIEATKRARGESRIAWSFLPEMLRVKVNGEVIEKPFERLRVDDLVELRPGERAPGDGEVMSGETAIDLSLLTGESRPVNSFPGSEVDAGALNLEATVELRIKRLFPDTHLGRLLEQAKNGRKKAQILELADLVGKYFSLVVLALGSLTFLLWYQVSLGVALNHTLSLLIVSCPCAFAFASPLAFSISVSQAAKRGILIKGAEALERLAKVRRIFFDKTGTLTLGRPRVVECFHFEKCSEAEISAFILPLVEETPNHPVARGLLDWAKPRVQESILCERATVEFGKGISGRFGPQTNIQLGSLRWLRESGVNFPDASPNFNDSHGSGVGLARNGRLIACFLLRDEIRPGVRETISLLKALGQEVVILSGDRKTAVTELCDELQVEGLSELYPEEKAKRISDSASISAMVGDGVNDMLAMQAADVSIAFRGALPANLEIADIIVTQNELDGVLEAILGARRTMRLLRLMLVGSLLYNMGAAGLAICGRLNPLVAALIMPVSSVSVIFLAILVPRFRGGRAIHLGAYEKNRCK